MAVLVVLDEAGEMVAAHEVVHGMLIGRGRECMVRIEDGRTSRRHAQIVRTAAGWTIEDLGSMNGLLVNDMRLTKCPLRGRERIVIGKTCFRFDPGMVRPPSGNHGGGGGFGPPPSGDDGDGGAGPAHAPMLLN